MPRATNAPASRERRRRRLELAKGIINVAIHTPKA